MKKQERQRMIKQVLHDNDVYRQEDLVRILAEKGVWVTQATVSRDVKDMQLIKLPTLDGTYVYSMPTEKKMNTEKKITKIISETYVFSNCHEDLCVVKVLPGNGPVLSSLIDQMNYPEVFATLGDDNTIMIYAYSPEDAQQIQQKLLAMVENNS
ncbi:ArgR family transcriptional regulator [Ligilactobacillus sp. WILCCON 0076]|uniref:Arginine repressor n=1 Tax=Ligilactobacillus ubinensis TaxID=2876789 RepID=A0A9X2FJ65_9LACO|nr:ArgR family transcriptional regulator [Ligilactobacillus ubinensis]MCP0886420.1 ArgR family transcriptional regulator [Ligilactobacillus ubinensis]